MALKEINKCVVLAWCPFKEKASLLALGSVDAGKNTLDLCTFDISSPHKTINVNCSVKVQNKFNCIEWGGVKTQESLSNGLDTMGVIAGGMDDGTVTLWNPAVIFNSKGSDTGHLSTLKSTPSSSTHSPSSNYSSITCMEFNPHRETLLASGGGNGDLKIIDVQRINDVAVYKKPNLNELNEKSELTSLGWNKKVSHILATTSTCGITVIWDFKQQKPIVSFRDPANRIRPSCISWLPDQATQIVVSYDDEANSTLQLWDLRNANYPLREITAHSKGILCTTFNPIDPNLMLSCGKDNRTICWSISSSSDADVYCDISTYQWNKEVKWSPHLRGVFASASHNDYVAIYNINNCRNSSPKYVPKWFKPNCGVNCGFGGKIVTFDSTRRSVKCHVVPTDKELISRADLFELLLNEGDYLSYCQNKIRQANDKHEMLTWNLVNLLFQENGRCAMVRELGFDSNNILSAVEKYLGYIPGTSREAVDTLNQNQLLAIQQSNSLSEVDPEKFFKELGEKNEADELEKQKDEELAKQKQQKEQKVKSQQVADWSKGTDNLIKNSVLIGNIESAVEVCLKHGRMADALLLASTGSSELWNKTKQQYINLQTDHFLKIIGCIINNDLYELVNISDLNAWEESLAILCTYASSDQFKSLCEALACRLEREKFDIRAAVICYLCAGNFTSTIQIWSNMAVHHSSMQEGLQDLVEKMAVLKAATNFDGKHELLSQKITKYAEILANSGRLKEAMRYLCLVRDDANLQIAYLRDRIYHSSPSSMRFAGVACPPRPFDVVEMAPVEDKSMYVHQHSTQNAQYNKQMQQSTGGVFGGNAFYPPMTISQPHAVPPTISHPSNFPVAPPPAPTSYSSPNQVIKPPLTAANRTAASATIGNTTPSYVDNNFNYSVKSNTSTGVNTPHHHSSILTPQSSTYASQLPYHAQNNLPSSNQLYMNNTCYTASNISPPTTFNQHATTHISSSSFAYPQNISHAVIPPPTARASPQPNNAAMPLQTLSGVGRGGMNKAFSPINQTSVVENSGGVYPNNLQTHHTLTAPTASATPIKPGMPVPWPIPTPTQQLASTTYSTAAANQRVHEAAAMPRRGPPMNSTDLEFVKRVINAQVDLQTQHDTYSKKTEDLKKKTEELFEKLREGFISESACDKVLQFCVAFDQQDIQNAQKVYADLSHTEWDVQNKHWLIGLRRLLPK